MGFLVLCFDDGHLETYTTAYPMLTKYNLVGVVGVITGYAGAFWRDWTNEGCWDFQLATLSQLLEMRSSGWEMVSHSLTHSPYDWILRPENNREYLDMSLRESRDWIVRNRLGDGRTFIYPFGATPGGVTEIVKKYYWLARTTEHGPPNAYHDLPLDSHQRYRLASYAVEHPVSTENLAEIRERVRYAIEEPALMTLTFHRITDQPRIWDIRLEELETILDIIAEEGAQTSTFERVIEQVWGPEKIGPTSKNHG